MIALSEDENRHKNNFQKIKNQVENIKMILRCGICCSTVRDPIMTTCNHAFCRACLLECFKRLSVMRCPVCNMTLNKRSCASCPLLSSLLEKYLSLAKTFKQDVLATDFAKENDFIESQIPLTQAASSLQHSPNQSRKMPRKEWESAKRHITHPQHRPVKMQRIDGIDYSNLATGIVMDAFPRISAVEHSYDAEAMHNEKNQKNCADKSGALNQIEAIVNSVFEKSKNLSRIEVLIKCMPWIPDFLHMDGDELIKAICGTSTKEQRDKTTPWKNGIDLVLESDGETEIAVPVNSIYAIDCYHRYLQPSNDRSAEQRIVSFLKDKQCYEADNEMHHSMMVSGASSLSDQSLLHEFLDNFPSFELSTSMNRKCTHLVIFNTDGLICEFWTVKLIYALVNHCTIVSYSWLENCLKQKSVLPASDFEILLKIDETLVNITTQRALTDPSTLFCGHAFYVPKAFFNTQLISRDVFLEILELSGGKTVSHVWELLSEHSYIIFAPDCFNRDAARRFELDMKKEVLKADWIFASIGQHRILDKKPYRLIHSVG